MAEISKETIKAYALENAIKYKGKANQGAVLSGLFAEGLENSEIKNYMPKIIEVLKGVNEMDPDSQEEEFEKLKDKTSKRVVREGLPDLPEAKEGEVVMRMAPYPSGPLHIGNARTLILNDEYVKRYKGKLILFMDDTIGSEGKPIEPEAYSLIEEGIKEIGITFDKVLYKSDRTSKYYEYAEELLKKGYLYVCDCEPGAWKELKDNKKECACRNIKPEDQLKRWSEMFKAAEGSMCVRIKTAMDDPDPAFRDRVMFKISDRTHPRTKNKYRVYPSMEFSWAIDDTFIGTTHVLRGTEHHMSTRVQDFIRGIFGWKNPVSVYNGIMEIEGVKISKSKGASEVKSGKYTGWNDPRLWSLQSLNDRGIKPEALREFVVKAGIKKTNVKVPVDVLYTINKKLLEESSRYFFIENPEKITIKGAPHLTAKIPLHPDGTKGIKKYETTQDFLISKDDLDVMSEGNIRLMHLLNFKVSHLQKFGPREFSYISTEPNNDLKTKYIHWLPASLDNWKVEIRMQNGDVKEGLGESKLSDLKTGEIVQFERFGFVKLHKKSKDKLEFWYAHN